MEISQTKFMKEALKEAGKCSIDEDIPVGAVVILDGKIIGRGYNQREKNHDPTGHAEIVAMRQAAKHLGTWRLNRASLYTTFEPCPMCAGAMVQARIKNLFFGLKNLKAGAAGTVMNLTGSKKFNHRLKVKGGIFEEESRRLIKDFFKKLRGK